MGKCLVEKMAKIGVKGEALFCGIPQSSAFCFALVNVVFNSDLLGTPKRAVLVKFVNTMGSLDGGHRKLNFGRLTV